MAGVDRKAQIDWEGDVRKGGGTLHLATSGAGGDLPVSLPTRAGESNGQTSPEELIAASHAGCYAMALSMVLGQQGHAPDKLDASAVVTLEPKEGGGYELTRSALTVKGTVSGLDADAFEQAAKDAEQACPVSNALRGNVEITVDASLEEG
jgi:osmotically inducible protein OsmC